jgi:hypothetical protein
MRLARRIAALALVAACVAAVIGYQSTRPAAAHANPVVFVPSSSVYKHLSPSAKATLADVYWLTTIQYYGEHVQSDNRLDSLPAMVRLIADLSPHFKEAYLFGSFAMADAGQPGEGYALLKKGFAANPGDWRFPSDLGFFAYRYGSGPDKDRVASQWYVDAARLPGAPPFMLRLAAELATKAKSKQTAIDLWTQAYAQGEKYQRQKAVTALDTLLPSGKIAREKAVAGLESAVPKGLFAQFVADLFQGYR